MTLSLKTVISALDHCSYYKAYPNVSLLLKLLATIPMTTAEAERATFLQTRTNSESLAAIRSTMDEQRYFSPS